MKKVPRGVPGLAKEKTGLLWNVGNTQHSLKHVLCLVLGPLKVLQEGDTTIFQLL